MTPLLLALVLAPLPLTPQAEFRVSLIGPPKVRHVLLASQTHYFGNDVQLTQRVHVTGQAGEPAPNRQVAFFAITRSGVTTRVPTLAVTDTDGYALVVGYLDLPTSDMTASLQACIADTIFCSPSVTTNLLQRLDVQVGTTYSNIQDLTNFGEGDRVDFSPRVEYLLHQQGGESRPVALTGFAATGFSLQTESLGGSQFRGVGAGVNLQALTRFSFDVSIDWPTSSSDGAADFGAQAFHSLSERMVAIGRVSLSRGWGGEPTPADTFRTVSGGLVFDLRDGKGNLQVFAGWAGLRQGGSAKTDPGFNVEVASVADAGGPFNLAVFGSLSGLRDRGVVYSYGATLTIRHFLHARQ